MSGRNDDALTTLLLTNHLTESDAQPLSPREYWQLIDTIPVPSALLGESEAEIAKQGATDAARIVRLLESPTRLAFELERLETQGFFAITPWDDEYPERL